MKGFLEERRIETDHYVNMASNLPRDKSTECIWDKPKLLEKTNAWLLENIPYYKFCDECLGSKYELPLASHDVSDK